MRPENFKHTCKQQHLSQQCYGILGVFNRGKLRIIESNKEFACAEESLGAGKVLSEDIIQDIKNKEAIAPSYESCKAECMTGAWIIEDDYKIASD